MNMIYERVGPMICALSTMFTAMPSNYANSGDSSRGRAGRPAGDDPDL